MRGRISHREATRHRTRRRNRRRSYYRIQGRISSLRERRHRMRDTRCSRKRPGQKRQQPARPEGSAARRDSDGWQLAAGPSAADTSAACAPSSKTTRTSPSCRQGPQDPAFHTSCYRRNSPFSSCRSLRKGPFRSLLPYSIAPKGDILDRTVTSARLMQTSRLEQSALTHPTTAFDAAMG